MRSLAIFTALILSVACQPAPKAKTATMEVKSGAVLAVPTGLPTEDEAAIRAGNAEWARAATAGDGGAIAALYAPDAVLLPANEPVVKGEAVKQYWVSFTDNFSAPTEITTMTVDGRGDLAYMVGTIRQTLTPKKAGAKPLPAYDGKFMSVLKKQPDGSWKIIYDTWNENTPPGKH